jgi:hypothetical protein
MPSMIDAALIRKCGLRGMVGGAALAIGSLMEMVDPSFGPEGVVDPVGARLFLVTLALVAMPGLFATQYGFYACGAAGSGRFAKVILIIGGVGCLLIAAPSLVTALTLRSLGVEFVGQLATMMLAPILWGHAALRAKRVATWKRMWPVLTGLWPPLMFAVVVPAGFPPFAVPGFAGILWIVFGFAVWTEGAAPDRAD